MTHYEIWNAIDQVAEKEGLSCSGLAKQCGLDSTVFNKSKRFSKYGQPRWPSTETISKILDFVNADIHDFAQYFPRRKK